MSEYQHKPLLEQVCQHLDGWQVDDSEEMSWACFLVHTSEARVQVNGDDKLTFTPKPAHFENHYHDFSSFPRVAISVKKPATRIASELQRRLLGEFLLAYEEAMTYMQAAYAREVEATAFLESLSPLFPEAGIGGKSETPELHYSALYWTQDEFKGISHITAKLEAHYKEGWEVKVSGYGKKALAELLNKVAVMQPEPVCGS